MDGLGLSRFSLRYLKRDVRLFTVVRLLFNFLHPTVPVTNSVETPGLVLNVNSFYLNMSFM